MRTKVISSNQINYNWTFFLNVFLMGAVVFMLMYYIISSNMSTAFRYRTSVLNKELNDLVEENSILTAKKIMFENSLAVLEFAQSHNMAEAKHVTHLFEGSDVAQR